MWATAAGDLIGLYDGMAKAHLVVPEKTQEVTGKKKNKQKGRTLDPRVPGTVAWLVGGHT